MLAGALSTLKVLSLVSIETKRRQIWQASTQFSQHDIITSNTCNNLIEWVIYYIGGRNRWTRCSLSDRSDYLTVFVSQPRLSLSGLGVTLTQHTWRFIINALAHLSLPALKRSAEGPVKADGSGPFEAALLPQCAVEDERKVAAFEEGASLKGETSCFHKSCPTLRGLKGHMVQSGGRPAWRYGTLMGSPDNALPPTPSLQNALHSATPCALGNRQK